MAYARIWMFRPTEGGEKAFAEAYSANGPWSQLFARAEGFEGVSLLRPADAGGWWMTVDRWRSEDDFRAFERDSAQAYRELDRALGDVAGEERFLGAFEDAG
jgi:heme-degrading monooxygenase HmoA